MLPAPAPAPEASPVAATDDGRPLLSAEPRWCYGQAGTDLEGGCFENREACQLHREGQVAYTMGRLLESLSPAEKDTPEKRHPYAYRAYDTWSTCAARSAFACFAMTRVVTGEKLELCYPTVATCDTVLAKNELDPDLVLRAKRCAVLRSP
jgi:hypothetical protein